ncbi:hypothetical protein MLD38_016788 [Melastoma candidum]|uniref:Uncharacterized protein n=1 Tax=Melastoma candidum TaxID=119954 RepID=A0ACB9QNP1_9MYRT|nr:hypothetical protein MLD38_016788 [Melastoma candidum]
MDPSYIFHVNFTNDEDEVSFTFRIINESFTMMLELNETGTIQPLSWLSDNRRKNGNSITCNTGEGFLKIPKLKTPDTSVATVDLSLSLTECVQACLNNCSCVAYASDNDIGAGSGCLMWHGDLVDIRTFSGAGQDLYVRVDAAELDNFSIANKLGQGGFGTVYKGVMTDGMEVAAKRLSELSRQGDEEFRNEVNLIAKLQHINLVKMLGFCLQDDEKILVYEYLLNRRLDILLFGKIHFIRS